MFTPPSISATIPRCSCGRKVYSKGLCSRCYQRVRRGDLPVAKKSEKPTVCIVCHGESGRPVKSKGLCSRCYYRQHKLRFGADEETGGGGEGVPLSSSLSQSTTARAARERLLVAAEALFSDQEGYRSATVRDITRKAGCNLAAVNYHFGGKSNLYGEVLLRRLQRETG